MQPVLQDIVDGCVLFLIMHLTYVTMTTKSRMASVSVYIVALGLC